MTQSAELVTNVVLTIDSFLDPRDVNTLEHKLDSFSSVYRRLTGKEVCTLDRKLVARTAAHKTRLAGSLRVPGCRDRLRSAICTSRFLIGLGTRGHMGDAVAETVGSRRAT